MLLLPGILYTVFTEGAAASISALFPRFALAACILSALVLVTAVFEKIRGCEAIGGGDLKLVFMMTAVLPVSIALRGLLLGLVFGAAYGMTRRGKPFPLVPFLSAGWTVGAVFCLTGMI